MSTQSRRSTLFWILFLSLTLSLALLPTQSTSLAQDDIEEISITLLFPDDINGNRPHFTIRIDGDIQNLDLSSFNVGWFDNGQEQHFGLSEKEQISSAVSNAATGHCIQLFQGGNPNVAVPLCDQTQIFSQAITDGEVFWKSGTGTFIVYQDTNPLKTCATVGSTNCTVDWPISGNVTPVTDTNTPPPPNTTDTPETPPSATTASESETPTATPTPTPPSNGENGDGDDDGLSPAIIAAIIGAIGTILAAIIGTRAATRSSKSNNQSSSKSSQRKPKSGKGK